MEDNLVIVESPAKAKTIERFLGKEFTVKSSLGHIRDLSKKNNGIDLEKNYQPQYEISPEKKKIAAELRKMSKQAKTVWLASDEDREGEAIAWHLSEVLNLPEKKTKRIVFHEITKYAIVRAIENPRGIDMNLVNAQQARRVLDRIVGFNLSPLLWKKIKPSLSAGRVQSVAVRLIVEREREISAFQPDDYYNLTGYFNNSSGQEIKADYSKKLKSEADVKNVLQQLVSNDFKVMDIQVKPGEKKPAPPFTTSTLQQEASRKLGFSVSRTMRVAQSLYESGLITYMRTDSLNLSKSAMAGAKEMIVKDFGASYSKTRNFKTKSKGAQEAHEAIRPTYITNKEIKGNEQEQKLYDLIWKRTVASQMANAKLEKTQVKIDCGSKDGHFNAYGEVIKFEGFLKLYIESTENGESGDSMHILPVLKTGEQLDYKCIQAIQRFTQQPYRYSEASLVRKMEELGIGRPSTYAPTISTIQQREYVRKGSTDGKRRNYKKILLENGNISEKTASEMHDKDKGKLIPSSLGMVVNDFLKENFKDIMDYNFTARVESQFDEIAMGKIQWNNMIDDFYKPFISQIKEIEEKKTQKWERHLGDDPKTGKPVKAKIGRYGPYVQIGDTESEEKPLFASLRKNQNVDKISLDEALELFKLPREVGEFEEKPIVVGIGRYGPYVRHDNKFYSLGKSDDPFEIEKGRALDIIKEGREKAKNKLIKEFSKEGIQVLNGRYGAYIKYKKKNFRIPKSLKVEDLSLEDCQGIIDKKNKKKK